MYRLASLLAVRAGTVLGLGGDEVRPGGREGLPRGNIDCGCHFSQWP